MRLIVIVALLAAACTDPPIEPLDAGHDAGTEDASVGPMPSPIAPALVPSFACPDGWAPVTLDEGPSVCDPFPMGRAECGPNERPSSKPKARKWS